MDETQVESEVHLKPDVLKFVLWTRLNTHSTDMTAQVKEDDKKRLQIYHNGLGSLKKKNL